ncbi:MAG TPA: radical SAM protein [Syntrophales bacterium]|nr:radical SAM protein [Syntrophales bacterium]
MPLPLPARDSYPKQLIVDIHSYCNARCSICPYPFLKKKNPMGIMDENLFIKIIDDFSDLSKKNEFRGDVLFCNMGELFVHPKIAIDRLRYVIQSDLNFSIQTNAELMTPEVVDSLKGTGFNGPVTISCHGISADVYKRIMGLNIDKTLRNIDYLSHNYSKDKVDIQSIPYHWPRGEAKRVRSFFRQKDITVRMPLPNNRAGLLPEIAVRNKTSLCGCNPGRPLGEMVICFDGAVVLCCNDMGREEIVGNLKNNTIQGVWNGNEMLQKISQIYGGAPSPNDFICKKCEFGITQNGFVNRLVKNIRYETEKFFLAYLW